MSKELKICGYCNGTGEVPASSISYINCPKCSQVNKSEDILERVKESPLDKLLGKKDLGATEFPPVETALVAGEIAFRQHTAGHTPVPNWPTFIEFASRYFNK